MEMCPPTKEYINGQKWERLNMVAKCIVHMHITAQLKAYWILVFPGVVQYWHMHVPCHCIVAVVDLAYPFVFIAYPSL